MNPLFKYTEKEIVKTYEFPINIYSDVIIPLLSNEIDNEMIQTLTINLFGHEVEVETIWVDSDNSIMLHCDDNEFEGDIKLTSLSDENIVVVMKYIQTLNMTKEG